MSNFTTIIISNFQTGNYRSWLALTHTLSSPKHAPNAPLKVNEVLTVTAQKGLVNSK